MSIRNKLVPYSNQYGEVRGAMFNVLKGYAVLDLGFGHINNLLKLKKRFNVVFGVDDFPTDKVYTVQDVLNGGVNEIKLATLEKLKKQNVFVIIDDYNRALKNFKNNMFDVVIMSFSWYGAKQRKRLAGELYRIVKKGGMFYLKHPLTDGEVKLIRDAGWKLVQQYSDDEYIFIK